LTTDKPKTPTYKRIVKKDISIWVETEPNGEEMPEGSGYILINRPVYLDLEALVLLESLDDDDDDDDIDDDTDNGELSPEFKRSINGIGRTIGVERFQGIGSGGPGKEFSVITVRIEESESRALESNILYFDASDDKDQVAFLTAYLSTNDFDRVASAVLDESEKLLRLGATIEVFRETPLLWGKDYVFFLEEIDALDALEGQAIHSGHISYFSITSSGANVRLRLDEQKKSLAEDRNPPSIFDDDEATDSVAPEIPLLENLNSNFRDFAVLLTQQLQRMNDRLTWLAIGMVVAAACLLLLFLLSA